VASFLSENSISVSKDQGFEKGCASDDWVVLSGGFGRPLILTRRSEIIAGVFYIFRRLWIGKGFKKSGFKVLTSGGFYIRIRGMKKDDLIKALKDRGIDEVAVAEVLGELFSADDLGKRVEGVKLLIRIWALMGSGDLRNVDIDFQGKMKRFEEEILRRRRERELSAN